MNYDFEDDEHQRWKLASVRKGMTLKAWIRKVLNEAADREQAEDDRRRGR